MYPSPVEGYVGVKPIATRLFVWAAAAVPAWGLAGQDENVAGHRDGAVVGVTQRRLPAAARRQGVFGGQSPRWRPEAGAGPAGGDDCDRPRQDATSSASSFARDVDSHGASMSVRPKCPYTAVCRYSGRRRLSSLMMPNGLRSNSLLIAAAIFASDTRPVPNVSTRIATGFTTPIAYDTCTSHREASPAATMFLAM